MSLPDAVCQDCIAFNGEERGVDNQIKGRCRFRPELGLIPSELPCCPEFKVRRERADKVRQPAPEPRRRGSAGRSRPTPRPVTQARPTLDQAPGGDTDGEISMDRDGLKQVLRELLEAETLYGYPEISQRWEGGTMVLKPANPENQPKEVSLESFFHKIVMLRDRLRVLEAKINGQSKLSEGEKVEMQGYITKCYGTLTTFNILFQDKEDSFRSK